MLTQKLRYVQLAMCIDILLAQQSEIIQNVLFLFVFLHHVHDSFGVVET